LGINGGFGVLFTGSYRRALDDKSRLPIPRSLRTHDTEPGRLYLTPGLDGCLAIYPEPAFAAVAERLAGASPAVREVRDYSRLFYSQAACVTPDSQWRIRVPPQLAQWAGLTGEIVVVGVRDHLEVWPADKWEAYVSRCDSKYDELAELALSSPAPSSTSHLHPAAPSLPQPALSSSTPTQPR
jgi:MraZ protein